MSDQPDFISVIVARYRALVQEWHRAEAQINQLKAHQQSLATQATDCFAASRVFGFDLNDEFQKVFDAQLARPELAKIDRDEAVPIAPPPLKETAASKSKGTSIKNLILELAESAYPNAVKASGLRKQLEQRGIMVHEKTVGMSLYRWARQGRVRRQGWEWFFVPELERATSHQGQESPGDDPGLLLAAD